MWGLTESPFIDNATEYAYADKVFSEEELDKIIEVAKNFPQEPAKIRESNEASPHIRYGDVRWLPPAAETEFIYRGLTDFVIACNEKWFNFDLFGFIEPLQFTIYEGEGTKFEPHIDKSFQSTCRKLSLVVQLNDPEEYEGGELVVINSGTPYHFPKKRGFVAVFPSYTLHQVTPIIKGNRYTLVAWVGGPSFK